MTAPLQPECKQKMNFVAGYLDRAFNGEKRPRTTFFVLLTGKFGEMDAGRVNYISNGQREEMITALKELLARFEGRYAEGGTKQ